MIELTQTQSEQLDAFYPAFLEAQKNMGKLEKNKVNDYHGNAYADLGTVLNVCRPTFNDAGIVIMFFPFQAAGTIGVQTKLVHAASGQWVANFVQGPLPKQDAQGIGIAITYFRRYGLTALIGLAQEDPDGNLGEQKPKATQAKQDYKKNIKDPTKINNFIQAIRNQIYSLKDADKFLDYVTQELPIKDYQSNAEKKQVFDICLSKAKNLQITYLADKKIWVKNEELEGMGECLTPPIGEAENGVHRGQ